MNAKISLFVNCVKAIIYLLSYNLHDCTFNFDELKTITAQKMKLPIKDFFSKCDQIRSLLRIWSHLLKKSLMKDFVFSVVYHIIIM